MHLVAKLLTILAVYLAFLPSIIIWVQPVLMQGSDYLMTFYPAGALTLLGRIADIYTPPGMSTFIGAPFDAFVHKTFPAVNPAAVAIYMYSPLIALFFAPLATLAPTISMIAWQLINVVAGIFCAYLFARKKTIEKLSDLSVLFLFVPVFHTLLIGQLGIFFGLLPLALAYRLLLARREFACGLVLALLYMKPQFLPCAMLVAGAMFFSRRYKTALGLIIGLALMVAVTVVATGPAMMAAFVESVKMSDTCYSFEGYKPPVILVTCLPAVILHCFGHAARDGVKIFAYGLAALTGLAALWHCVRLWQPVGDDQTAYRRAVTLSFLVGLYVLPLVVPHFLFYDLCGLSLIAFCVHMSIFDELEQKKLQVLRRYTWWTCNLYFVFFTLVSFMPLPQHVYPFVLVCLLTLVLYRIGGFGTRPVAIDQLPGES